jgi:hypothetical protein
MIIISIMIIFIDVINFMIIISIMIIIFTIKLQ